MSGKWMIKDWTTGDLNALVKNLGGDEIARKIQLGEVRISFEDVVKVLFDKHGRRIPEGLQAKVRDADRDFRLAHPNLDEEVDFAKRILRLHGCLSIDTGVTAKQLKAETERLLAIIRGNSRIANIANGVCLPVIMPKLVTDDLGSELELYLEGVDKSYVKAFSDRKFYNHLKGHLENKVSVVDGSRHDQLIGRMKEGPVIGLHFPNPLQGFSIHAAREQMSTLTEGFILSGMDTPIAMVMCPDILAHDWNAPVLEMSALQWRFSDYSLKFSAYDNRLDFKNVSFLANAHTIISCGLLFIG